MRSTDTDNQSSSDLNATTLPAPARTMSLGQSLLAKVNEKFLRGKEKMVVACIEDARKAAQTNTPAILVGQAVFISFEATEDPSYVPAKTFLSFGDGKRITRQIDKEVIHELYDTPVAFAVDGYLRYGRRFKHDTVMLLGGAISGDSLNLELYIFEHGKLKGLSERNLPLPEHPHFEGVLDSTLQEFYSKFPITRTFLANCLPDIPEFPANIERLGDAPLKQLIFIPGRHRVSKNSVIGKKAKKQKLKTQLAPLVVLLTGLGAFAGLSWTGFSKYQQAVNEFKTATESEAVRRAGGVDEAMLRVMQARKAMLDAAPVQHAQAQLMIRLANAAASLPDIRVQSISTPQQSSYASGDTMRIIAYIDVAALGSAESSMQQGRTLAQELAKASGLAVTIDAGGFLRSDANGIRYWRMSIPDQTVAQQQTSNGAA